jgi:hypothetical protein
MARPPVRHVPGESVQGALRLFMQYGVIAAKYQADKAAYCCGSGVKKTT